MMFEYAITDGEGTLIDYGKIDEEAVLPPATQQHLEGWDDGKYSYLLIAHAADDCTTGE